MRQMPKLWHALSTNIFHLNAHLAWCWWRALARSRWSRPVGFREAFVGFIHRPLHMQTANDLVGFLQRTGTPQQLMDVLEDLKKEGLLTLRDANRIEETVLQWVRADGLWK